MPELGALKQTVAVPSNRVRGAQAARQPRLEGDADDPNAVAHAVQC